MRRIDERTTIAVVVTMTIIAAAAIQFGWKLSALHETGWAGLAYFYQPNREKVVEISPFMEMFLRADGEVTILIEGGPAERAGIEFGDRVESINGIPIEAIEKLESLGKGAEPGDTLDYVVRRGEASQAMTVELTRLTESRPQMVSFATSLITGFGFLVISILLFTAGPRSKGALVFLQLCVVGALFFFFAAAFEFDMNDSQGIVSIGSQLDVVMTLMVYGLLAILMSNLLLHFSLVFPRKRPVLERNPSVRWWIHVGPFALPVALLLSIAVMVPSSKTFFPVVLASSLLMIIAGALTLMSRRRDSGGWKPAVLMSPLVMLFIIVAVVVGLLTGASQFGPRVFMSVYVVVMMLVFAGSFLWGMAYLALTIVNFLRSYRSSNAEEKRQIRWPLWGTIVSLALVSAVGIVVIALMALNPSSYTRYASTFAWFGALAKLGYLVIPVSFGLGIQKYGLLQIDTILRKTFVYAVVTSFIVIAYLVFVGLLGVTLVSMTGIQSQAVIVAATLLVAAMFVPVRNRVQTFVDSRFFKRQQDYDDVRRSLARMTATSRNLEEFLDAATDSLRKALGVPALAIFCRAPSGSSLVLRRSYGVRTDAGSRFELGGGDPLAQPGARLVDLEEHSSRSAAINARYGLRLQTAEGVIGALTVSDRSRDPLGEEDLDFLRGIADQLALGISSLQIRTDDLELVQARQIQRSLLPSIIPQIRGVRAATAWIPARSVGGDYYDVLSLGDNKIGFCIGDVVGKGMPAALLMSGLQSAVRAIAPADSSTDVTVAGIRRVAVQNLTGGTFITFFYGTVDSEGNVEFTNAGHNQPLLVRSDGSVTRLSGHGAAIARMMVDAELSAESLRLARGDTIILFTDGVSEAPRAGSNDFDEIYGEDRLEELVTQHRSSNPEDLVGIILDDVREYTGGEFADDLTLVVVRAV